MTERLNEHKMKYAVDTDKEAEDICRWAMKAVALRWMTIRRQIKRSTICCVR